MRAASPLDSPRRVAVAAGAILFALYAATAARDVTFWDAGEFLAAFHTFGIPHPPGTPLFVLLGRVATLALAPLGAVLPASLLSAACTALAGALSAWLVRRWTGSAAAAVAAALAAGATSSVWLNATEPEVYAASLALSLVMLVAGERAGRDEERTARWTSLLAFAFGVAVPLHLSALVAAPPAIYLASTARDGRLLPLTAARLTGLAIAAAGLGRASVAIAACGLAVVAVAARRERTHRDALRETALLALGASSLVVLLVRARLDPALNQGNPATWGALADVVARRQYAVAPLWPRQAPWWIQLANLGEWADWQIALGLHGGVDASPVRTPLTIGFLLLAAAGARSTRHRNPRAFRAAAVLFGASTLGVIVYLNLKAGPSFGVGVLPANAPHEARERDYFFALAFWTWGLLAGIGAVWLAARLLRRPWLGVALAALPVATNWRAVTRRREPEAQLPSVLAAALLASVPPNGVYLAIGDNDSYPVWFEQLAAGERPDVTPVTIPLLGAGWYRAELARRHGLLPADVATRWYGLDETVRAIARSGNRRGRPVAISAGVDDSTRAALGGRWTRRGVVWLWAVDGARGVAGVDRAATEAVARTLPSALFAPLRDGGDGVAEWAQGLLRCPVIIATPAPTASLDESCNSK